MIDGGSVREVWKARTSPIDKYTCMGPVKLRAACDCGERSGGDETLRLIMEGAVIGLGGQWLPPLNVFKKNILLY